MSRIEKCLKETVKLLGSECTADENTVCELVNKINKVLEEQSTVKVIELDDSLYNSLGEDSYYEVDLSKNGEYIIKGVESTNDSARLNIIFGYCKGSERGKFAYIDKILNYDVDTSEYGITSYVGSVILTSSFVENIMTYPLYVKVENNCAYITKANLT